MRKKLELEVGNITPDNIFGVISEAKTTEPKLQHTWKKCYDRRNGKKPRKMRK